LLFQLDPREVARRHKLYGGPSKQRLRDPQSASSSNFFSHNHQLRRLSQQETALPTGSGRLRRPSTASSLPSSDREARALKAVRVRRRADFELQTKLLLKKKLGRRPKTAQHQKDWSVRQPAGGELVERLSEFPLSSFSLTKDLPASGRKVSGVLSFQWLFNVRRS
jgi:hypothetical protein